MKPGRNEPCYCGSGKKFKHCCEGKAAPVLPIPPSAEINQHVALYNAGRYVELETRARHLVGQYPAFGFGWQLLGGALQMQGKDALPAFRKVAELLPGDADAHYNLGVALKSAGLFADAVTSYRHALKIKPDYAEAHYNLGNALKQLGQHGDAVASFRRALELKPDYIDAQSNLLFALNFMAGLASSHYLAEAEQYGRMAARKVAARFATWDCVAQPERLRVGLVSGDLCNHPVGYFLESLLAQLQHSRIELIAYPSNPVMDELTARIKPHFAGWKPLFGLNDTSAARLVHDDGVHVLIDLAGHTGHNRLPMFAWKPAPVQVSWLGYFATTGIAEMDYLLADKYVVPDDEEHNFTETIWRLPESYLCFTAPGYAVEVSPLPALTNGYVTFGCFNNLVKMNDVVVALWARVLNAVPDSRLFLKTKQLKNPMICDTTRQRFVEHGISPERIVLESGAPRPELLATYRNVDIALDPFPYPGGTTSVESLWMGVPVITRCGDRFLSHMGETFAHNAGLADWIAADDDDYVAKAVQHTADLQRLAALRSDLRQQVLTSPIFDAPRFAGNFAAALWGMWQTWCDKQVKGSA